MEVATVTVRVLYEPDGPSPSPEVLATVARNAAAEAHFELAEALAEVDPGFEVRSGGAQYVARPLAA